jgi:hypothetical protein
MSEPKQTPRPFFDWAIFLLIYVILVAAIGWAAVNVYGNLLGWFVAGSAAIAGLVCLYLFKIEVPRETGYKIVLALTVSANAGWMVHNGALSIGTKQFNDAQIEKFKAGMEVAAKAKTKAAQRNLSLSARAGTELAKVFQGDAANVAALLAFLELVSALVIFADASKRGPATVQPASQQVKPTKQPQDYDEAEFDEWDELTDDAPPISAKSRTPLLDRAMAKK